MAVTTTANVALTALANYVASLQGGLLTPQATLGSQNFLNFSFTSGNSAINKIDQVYATQATIATASHTDVDLYALGGALDPGGNAYTLAKVKLLFIQNLGYVTGPAETDVLAIGGQGTAAAWCGSGGLFGANADLIKIPSPSATSGVGNIPGTFFWVANGLGFGINNTTSAPGHLLRLANTVSANTITYNLVVLGATA